MNAADIPRPTHPSPQGPHPPGLPSLAAAGPPPAEDDADLGGLLCGALDAAGTVAYIRDYVGHRFEYVGPAAMPLLGFAPEEFTEALWDSLVLEVKARGMRPGLPVAEATRQLREGLGPAWCAELRVRTAAGGERWLLNGVAKRRDAAGRVVGSVGVLIDQTESRRLRGALRESHALAVLGRVAAGAAHDLNNLLAVVSGYGELAMTELPAGHAARHTVRQILQAGGVAAAIVGRLQACARPGRRAAGAVEVNALISDLARLLQRMLGTDAELILDLAPGLWPVRASAGDLEQVLLNLTVNARDAMPAGGSLTVTTRNLADGGTGDGPAVLLEVRDTGAGMTDDVRARAFEPFFTTKGDRGSGLGLALTDELVKGLGGRVAVDSAPGRGATFRVILPRATP